MTHCLDTSAYSFFRRGHPALRSLVQTTSRLAISSIVIGELQAGFRRGSRLRENETALSSFLASPRVSLLVVDQTTAERYGEIAAYLRREGRPLPSNDVWIAAHAMQHGLRVMTLDRHFSAMPQVSIELFEP